MGQKDQGQSESELFFIEGVADIDYVQDDQDDRKDDEVEADQEGVVVDAGHEVVYGQDAREEVEDVVEGLAPVPHHYDREVEGELHHLDVVNPRLVQQTDDCEVLRLVGGLIHDYEEHVEDSVLEIGP